MELVTNTNSLQEHLPEFVISDIAIEWDWVKLGVEEIISSQANIKNRPEDVYASCKTGESCLLTAGGNRFVVAQVIPNEFTQEKSFFIWLAWFAPEVRKAHTLSDYLGFFDNLARNAGCTQLEAITTTKPLSRLYSSIGFEIEEITFVRKI